jgi:hypothetical protein
MNCAMARLSRIVVPDIPIVTRRGRRRTPFTEPGGYALYRDLLASDAGPMASPAGPIA